MTDAAARLKAHLDETEAWATADLGKRDNGQCDYVLGVHLVPEDVLRRVAAGRKILAEYETSHGGGPDFDGGYSAGLEFALRCLAEVFEEQPGPVS